MTAAYAPESWDGFALAVVTAAATLTGLLFVAVSINLQRGRPDRGAAAARRGRLHRDRPQEQGVDREIR
jgi:hypothetical protein